MTSSKHITHIIVGLSGGVDSAVSAYLLKEAGHQVEAVFMKNWEGDDTESYCSATQDIADAKAVCDKLNIPLNIVNFADDYWEKVFTYFLDEYRAGRTPNPDILCNKEIKFNAFLNYAKQCGADYIATGHYARLTKGKQGVQLLKANDLNKDQSYFLSALTQAQLDQSIFPLGTFSKTEVRALAKKIGLRNHAKKDSTGICFIGERKFKTFLNDYLPAKPGSIETLTGEIIGQHDGLMFYTIGQRQGLHIGGQKGKTEAPWYVARKDIQRNVLIVAQGTSHPALFQSSLRMSNTHWIHAIPDFPLHAKAKTRYRQPDQDCLIEKKGHNDYGVTFSVPQRAITPGQYIVFYAEDVCLGNGMIEG